MKTIRTPTLEVAYEEGGPSGGPPVVLLHGFPDDVRAYDGVAPPLAGHFLPQEAPGAVVDALQELRPAP